jgi:16S rRNA (adenine1518-N6/adenine1519-N6)-dimethyltransferase
MKIKKYLGQHFLKNKKILKFLANNLEDIHNNVVVEIGGGHGELTKYLINAKKLIVYEIDKELYEILKEKFPMAEIINQDFLKADLSKFKNNYYLIGNIPYYLTGGILRKIFSVSEHPKLAIFTLQKEYGEKLLGKNGENFLSVWAKIWCQIQKLMIIKKEQFYPPPKVDSLALKFIFFKKPLIKSLSIFEKFLKILFSKPKRTILNNLKNFYNLENINKDLLYKRPHQLSFDEVLTLFKNLYK